MLTTNSQKWIRSTSTQRPAVTYSRLTVSVGWWWLFCRCCQAPDIRRWPPSSSGQARTRAYPAAPSDSADRTPPPCKTNASAHRRVHELLLNIARCARSSRMRPGRTQPWTQPYTRRSCEPSPRSGSPGCAAPALRQVISLGWFNLWKHLVTRS